VFLTQQVREEYEQRLLSLIEETARTGGHAEAPAQGQRASLGARGATDGSRMPRALPHRLIEAYNSVNTYLTAFIGSVQSDAGEALIQPKPFLQRAFGLPPDMTQLTKPLFFEDTGGAWTETIFAGIEMDLLIFNILTFSVVDLGLRHSGSASGSFVAAVVTYLVQTALNFAKNYFGEKNLAKKTLIDARFLV
jgi:meckelin